ncbi:MAG TPA: helix-turn-helix transcriptional regulator, partial [Clostridiales bacterium]|nr:helix-turn-helix transcriptional regulator [Clostridiales bacterium]
MHKKANQQKRYYFSDSLRRQLDQIAFYPLTIVEAPSGFGKTTAIIEYLKRKLSEDADEYWYTCMGEPAVISWKGICGLFSNIDFGLAANLENIHMPTMDTLFYVKEYLSGIDCRKETFLVIDNFQLADCNVRRELINIFSMHGNQSLHVIFITQKIRDKRSSTTHNNNIHSINASDFLLDAEGTANLFRIEGIRLTDDELENVFMSTGGWISAIKLQIINYMRSGTFNFTFDIERLVENAIWNNLSAEEKDLLISVSVMESFTAPQAAVMIDWDVLPDSLEELLKTNDFIQYHPDAQIYSIHSIVRNYLQNRFSNHCSEEYKREVLYRAGKSYASISQYCQAAKFFFKVGDFNAILAMPFSREYFDNQKEKYQPEFIELLINECPEDIMCKHPSTMLELGYMTLACGQYEAYEKLCLLLQRAIENRSICEEEMRRIKGEFILMKSMGDFNDISKMIEGQKIAFGVLGGSSGMIKYGTASWLFSSPSSLDMFWREPGELENILGQIDEGEVLYRSIGIQGVGPVSIMRAEAMLMRGEEDEAEILCHKALYSARGTSHIGICICAELMFARIAILRGDANKYLTAVNNIKNYKKESTNLYLKNMADLCLSVISLILGVNEGVAPWIMDIESMKKVLYAPVVPHAQILYMKILLMERRYNEFYGISSFFSDTYNNENEKIKYAMTKLYNLKYLAIAKLNDGNHSEAQEYLNHALNIALPDKVYLPLAQQINSLHPLLESAKASVTDKKGFRDLIALGKRQAKGVAAIKKAVLSYSSPLTPREREVAALARDRFSAREIADKLYISETTV